MISNIFYVVLYQPLVNALVFFYNTIAFKDVGLSIILLTVAIRLLLYPLFQKSMKHQAILQSLQPKLKEIQESHKHDKTKQTEAMMALYKENNVSPFSSFGFLLIQLPVLIVLYRIFLKGFGQDLFSALYSWVSKPTGVENSLLGLINLAGPSIVMVVISAAAQYFQVKLSLPKDDGSPQAKAAKMMAWIGPALTILIFYKLPAAVALYWLITSILSIGQQILVNKQLKSNEQLGTISKKSY